MNIARVRNFFQKSWDITILTDNNANFNTCTYSLHQPTINSDDHFLYVTSEQNLNLVGDLLVIANQRFIVHKPMLEHSNIDTFVYKLIVAYDTLALDELTRKENAIGTYIDEIVLTHTCACAISNYGKKDRYSQPIDSYEQEFLIAAKQLPSYRGAYNLRYHDVLYKVTSFELDAGQLKIRATENL